tara:strand:- start:492 stop:809 length:318 start_codon:yes stop_codon:yes gene_type:complete
MGEEEVKQSLYHTNLRNIGVYITLFIGITTLSSHKIITSKIGSNVMKTIAMIFLLVSFLLSNELEDLKKKGKITISKNLSSISLILNYTIVFLILKMIYIYVIKR